MATHVVIGDPHCTPQASNERFLWESMPCKYGPHGNQTLVSYISPRSNRDVAIQLHMVSNLNRSALLNRFFCFYEMRDESTSNSSHTGNLTNNYTSGAIKIVPRVNR